MEVTKRVKKNYVDNKRLYESMVAFKKASIKAKKAGEPRPPIDDYICTCILKIAEHLSYKPNFINYPFIDDMVGDAVENCITYISNFNPKKSKNPFSYFTQIIYFAFLRRIAREKKQMVIKFRAIQNSPYFESLTRQVGDEAGEGSNSYIKFTQKHMGDIISDFEEKKQAKKDKKAKKNNLEKLF